LGPFFLGTAAKPQGARVGRKGQALLTAAAAHRADGVARSSLMAWLWPAHDEVDGRNALRQCLHQLRLALAEEADWLDTHGDRVYLRDGRGEVDLWQFERGAEQPGVEVLAAIAELYRGDFAADLVAEDGQDRWLWITREQARALAHNLVTRMLACDDAAILAAATRLARRLLADDPVHEGCYRALMLLYARAGLVAKAMQVWDECRRVLRQELDVAPSAQSTEIYEYLRSSSKSAAGVAAGSPPAAPAATSAARLATAPADVAAMDHMLRGWQLFSEFSADANQRARAEFAATVAHQPDNAVAIVRLGWTHFLDYVGGWGQDYAPGLERAAAAAAQAIACAHAYALAYALQGKILVWQMKHDAAIRQLQYAAGLAPDSAWTHFHLAEGLMWDGQYDQALQHVRRALQLEANDHGVYLTIEGFTLFFMGDLPAARVALTRALTRNPDLSWALGFLAAVYVEMEDVALARETALRARRLGTRMSLDYARKVLPIRLGTQRQRLVSDWRRAGMPAHEVTMPLPTGN
jgi:DNA-binding SARP family transcriptional activator